MNLSDLLCSTTAGCHRDEKNVCRCEDQDHSNLLHWSAGHGLTRLSEKLIKTGFTRYINLPNIQGLTPLDLAERHGDTGLVRMLKNHLLNLTLSSHQYPVTRPRSNTLLEDADGYLIPHTLEDIVSGHRTVEDTGPGHRLKQRHVSLSSAEEFYQRPPTPRPLTVSVCSIATGTTASTTSGSPPGASITSSTSSSSSTKCRSAGYIKMVSAPLKKAMSEPRSEAECFIPKSGSFSHFTMTNKKPGSALSREELIAKYCRDNDDPHTRADTSPVTSVHDDSRPGSTPPDLGSHHHSDNISIPHHHHETQDSDSSPLDHYVHTDPHLDGIVYLPIVDSPDANDREVSHFFKQSSSSNTKQPDMERSKSFRARLSPSRSRFFRRRRSGGSLQTDDNDNDITPIVEETNNNKKSQTELNTFPRSNSLSQRRNKEALEKFLYDVPRNVNQNIVIDKSEVSENMFTQVRPKPNGAIKNSNIGAYENVIINFK